MVFMLAVISSPTSPSPRVTAGTLKLLDTKEVSKRPLRFFAYAFYSPLMNLKSQSEILELLFKAKFPVAPNWTICKNASDVINYWQHWNNKRDDLPFETDGIVVKLNDVSGQEKLGFTSKSPRFAIAFKFLSVNAYTSLRDVTWQVGRTGILTPVAELEPVLLMGTIVKRATLHNVDELQRLGVFKNARVEIIKGGDIIPKVVQVIEGQSYLEIESISIPKKCPVCDNTLEKDEGGVALRCVNYECPAQIKARIEHFASRTAMDIEGLGEKTVSLLVDEGILRDIADIYHLKANRNLALQLPKMADISVNNLTDSIEKSKSRPFDRLLFALGIRHIGSTVAKLISQKFPNFESLMNAKKEELTSIEGIGDTIANSLVDYFRDPIRVKTIHDLIELGVSGEIASVTSETIESELITGKTFVLTGTLPNFTREEAELEIVKRGGKVTSSVSSKTDYVLVGDKPGSKLDKAIKLNVKILDEDEFALMLS